MHIGKNLWWLTTCALWCGLVMQAPAQAQAAKEPTAAVSAMPVVHLSASATTSVQQDWLNVHLMVQKDGADASQVQKQLQTILATALTQAQSQVEPALMNVSTGPLNVSPRYNREGKINGWGGSAELILQGRDTDRITRMAARVPGMVIGQIEWSVSASLREQTEARIQSQAVQQFKAKAAALSSQLGFAGYNIKEIKVSASSDERGAPLRMVAMAMDATADNMPPSVPVQAGQSKITVNVTGQIELR